MARRSVRAALLLVGIGLALAGAGCGKKAPLRLSDDRTAEKTPVLRGRVRLNRVTLDFRVPPHRLFPEREEPWVLARILRQSPPAAAVVEVGTLRRESGFAFDSPLTWTDQVLPAKSSFSYRVEFRDALRRRRALSEPLLIAWDHLPSAPAQLAATGRLRSIVVTWTGTPGASTGLSYRVYRRESAQAQFELLTPTTAEHTSLVDSRIETDRDYCYEVRAVLSTGTLEVEGSASPEGCSRAADEELPPAQAPAGVR